MTPEQLAQLLRDNPDLRHANDGIVGTPRRVALPVPLAHRADDPPALLVLPYPPSVNHYWTAGQGGARVLSAEARRYKAQVGMQCAALGLRPCAGNVALTVRVYRPAKRGDLDNVFKAVLDALIGHAYEDDGQVTEIHAFRHDDRNAPRIEVEVSCA